MQEAPIHQSHVYGRIEISPSIFEKGHPRNIPVKLFENWNSGFREEDSLRISSYLYSARSPHSPEPCLRMDQNFANNFWKGSPKEHFKIGPAVPAEKIFNSFPNKPWFLHVCSTSLLKTLGKGEIARKEQFLLFPWCFIPIWRTFSNCYQNLKSLSAKSSSLEESKICRLEKG